MSCTRKQSHFVVNTNPSKKEGYAVPGPMGGGVLWQGGGGLIKHKLAGMNIEFKISLNSRTSPGLICNQDTNLREPQKMDQRVEIVGQVRAWYAIEVKWETPSVTSRPLPWSRLAPGRGASASNVQSGGRGGILSSKTSSRAILRASVVRKEVAFATLVLNA